MTSGGRCDEAQRVRPLRLAISVVTFVVGGACVVLLGVALTGRTAVLSVPSPSMTPTIPVGAAITASPVAASDVDVGDVIVFQAPGTDHLTVHRVVAFDRVEGRRTFVTKGDANAIRDPWDLVLEDDSVHRVEHVVPHVGRVLAVLHGREVRLGLLGAGTVLFLATGLRAIWAGRRPVGAAVGRSTRARRRAEVIAAAVTIAAIAGSGGEAQAELSTASGSLLPVSSAALGAPADLRCAWASTTTLAFTWAPNLSGSPAGTRLSTSNTVGGTYTAAATITPASVSTTTISPVTPVTTNRFYRLDSFRGATWTGPPTPSIGSAACRGAISTVAGTGTVGSAGDGGVATSAQLNGPRGMAFGPNGDLFVADTANSRIRRITPAGIISTFAGGVAASTCSYAGPVSGLGLNQPFDVAVDAAGSVYIADSGANCVRKVDTAGNVTRVAGGGATTTCNSTGAATAVSLSSPRGVAVDAAGTVYIADSSRNCVRKVVGSTYSFVAGGGATATCNVTGATTTLSMSAPNDVQVDSAGAVYIADTGRNCVRKVVGATFSHVLGGGATTTCASSGAATSVALSGPEAIALDASGRVLVAEATRRCVRAVTGTNYAQVALTGTNSSTGDNGPALAATMFTPGGLVVAPDGALRISDRSVTAGGSEVRSIVGPWPL